MSSPVKDACANCSKQVYPMERLAADDKVFHKTCFKCEQCKGSLKLGTYAALDGKYYCKPHFKQLFAVKGNYNDGFGTTPHKLKWINPDSPGMPKPDTSISKTGDELNISQNSILKWSKSDGEGAAAVDDDELMASPDNNNNSSSPLTIETCDRPTPVNSPVSPTTGPNSPLPTEMCGTCSKKVYAVERLVVDGTVFHKSCLRCAHCNIVLSLTSQTSVNGQFFCRNHARDVLLSIPKSQLVQH